MHDFLFTFKNTHQALKGEKTLKKRGYELKLIPTPFEIFAECGFSLSVSCSEEDLDSLRLKDGWDFEDCYLMIEQEQQRIRYEKI